MEEQVLNDEKRTLVRKPNAEYRPREFLTKQEVDQLLRATSKSRWSFRDKAIIMALYRHGLRAGELCGLRWDDINWTDATLHVRRLKNSKSSTQPIQGDEMRALRRLQREQSTPSPYVFVSERGQPFTPAGINRIVRAAGKAAGLPFQAHTHMLRHACGYALANRHHDTRTIQDYLGHRNIQHTVGYTELAADRFNSIKW